MPVDERFTWSVKRMHEEPGGAVAELLRQRTELLRKVEAASSYIDRIPMTWREDLRAAEARVGELEALLERFTAGRRSDGTYNLSREAVEQMSKDVLAPKGDEAK